MGAGVQVTRFLSVPSSGPHWLPSYWGSPSRSVDPGCRGGDPNRRIPRLVRSAGGHPARWIGDAPISLRGSSAGLTGQSWLPCVVGPFARLAGIGSGGRCERGGRREARAPAGVRTDRGPQESYYNCGSPTFGVARPRHIKDRHVSNSARPAICPISPGNDPVTSRFLKYCKPVPLQ